MRCLACLARSGGKLARQTTATSVRDHPDVLAGPPAQAPPAHWHTGAPVLPGFPLSGPGWAGFAATAVRPSCPPPGCWPIGPGPGVTGVSGPLSRSWPGSRAPARPVGARRASAALPCRAPAGPGPPLAANEVATDLATSSSSDPRDVSLATRLVTTSRISVSRRIVSVCLDVSRFSRRSAPSWMALARMVASSIICLACALAAASVFSASLVASLMARSVSWRAELRILSASERAVAIAFSACSWAAVSIRSVCSRASVRILSASFFASSRSLAISSWARLRWALASSSASLSIWPTRSLTSSWAGLLDRP